MRLNRTRRSRWIHRIYVFSQAKISQTINVIGLHWLRAKWHTFFEKNQPPKHLWRWCNQQAATAVVANNTFRLIFFLSHLSVGRFYLHSYNVAFGCLSTKKKTKGKKNSSSPNDEIYQTSLYFLFIRRYIYLTCIKEQFFFFVVLLWTERMTVWKEPKGIWFMHDSIEKRWNKDTERKRNWWTPEIASSLPKKRGIKK